MNKTKLYMKNKAFTLIEIASVLIIAGLLLGGIVASNGFIKQGQINRVISDMNFYVTAIQNFKAFYGYYPGDLPNATTYFGATDRNGNTVTNGNGDLVIACGSECSYAWQHLALANLIPGVYTNTSSMINTPYTFYTSLNNFWQLKNYGNSYTGIPMNNLRFSSTNLQFNPLSLYIIDKKIDDGIASSGFMLTNTEAGSAPTPACVYDSAGVSANYTSTAVPMTYNIYTASGTCSNALFTI